MTVLNKSAASLTGRLTPPRHQLAALAGTETSTRFPPPHSTNCLSPTKRGAGARESPLNRFAPPRASARFSVFVSGIHGFDYRKSMQGMYAFDFLFSASYFWETVAVETRSLRKRRRERTKSVRDQAVRKGDNVSADECFQNFSRNCAVFRQYIVA